VSCGRVRTRAGADRTAADARTRRWDCMERGGLNAERALREASVTDLAYRNFKS
jgi:hypothetical protein